MRYIQCHKDMELRIKSLLLAIQRNDSNFKELLDKCEQQLDHTLSTTEKVNHICRKISGDTCLHVASRYGHLDIVRYLVEVKKAFIDIRNHDRKTPLHDSCQYQHLQCVTYLLEKGVDANAMKKADWSPLMLACTKTSFDIVSTLLKYGANPNLQNKDGWNSYVIACREGSIDIIEFLVNSVTNKMDLCNTRTKNGRKAIHTAALHGHTQVVHFILVNGFNGVNDVDNCGSSPLMDACRSNTPDLVDLLLDVHNADINLLNKEGLNCLQLAAQAGSADVVAKLGHRFENMDKLGTNIT